MDSDDDFLIEDDEDFDSGTKDELFDIVKQEKASTNLSTASGAPTSPAKSSIGSTQSVATANQSQNGGAGSQGPNGDGSVNDASAAQRQANPALVVAPKPLHTPATQLDSKPPLNQAANGSSTYANFSIF